MADKPIIFSAPMVRALLEGRKTQTRRIIKKAAALDALAVFGPQFLLLPGNADLLGYAPGGRLYVREACATWLGGHDDVVYRADEPLAEWHNLRHDAKLGFWKIRSPIHMPRWASRLTLTVTDVRVQRLQEISEADAVAEGCKGFVSGDGEDGLSPQEEYRDLWNSPHGSGAWAANPWVAAYSFTVQRGNIDQIGGAA